MKVRERKQGSKGHVQTWTLTGLGCGFQVSLKSLQRWVGLDNIIL